MLELITQFSDHANVHRGFAGLFEEFNRRLVWVCVRLLFVHFVCWLCTHLEGLRDPLPMAYHSAWCSVAVMQNTSLQPWYLMLTLSLSLSQGPRHGDSDAQQDAAARDGEPAAGQRKSVHEGDRAGRGASWLMYGDEARSNLRWSYYYPSTNKLSVRRKCQCRSKQFLGRMSTVKRFEAMACMQAMTVHSK